MLMASILAQIVEFRNAGSGLHAIRVSTITRLILERLRKRGGKSALSKRDIALIRRASALHDIGKIAVPDEILNKPGRLTPEEFEVMKTHSMKGAEILDALEMWRDEPLVKYAYQICRWHHERWDGKGYPDGISGDKIPIAAQVVAIADVYDALTNNRVYKKAFPHEDAVRMILDGECGAMNPELLSAFSEVSEDIRRELEECAPSSRRKVKVRAQEKSK